jgi:hypothetical protein
VIAKAVAPLAFGTLVLATVQAAAQGLPPVGIDEIMSGTRSCLSATSSTGVDEQKLQSEGWHHATLSSNGKPIENGLTSYGKGGLLMILSKTAATPLCALSARIAAGPDYLKLQAAMATLYGGSAGTDPDGEYVFMTTDHHIIDLAPTGSNDSPAVRVAVGPVPQEKK